MTKKQPTVEDEIRDLLDEDAEPGDDLPESEPTDDIGTLEEPVAEAAAPAVEAETTGRVFKIGSSAIYESEATVGLTNEQVRDTLKAAYPEIANATIGEKVEDGVRVVSFLPQPGRKG